MSANKQIPITFCFPPHLGDIGRRESWRVSYELPLKLMNGSNNVLWAREGEGIGMCKWGVGNMVGWGTGQNILSTEREQRKKLVPCWSFQGVEESIGMDGGIWIGMEGKENCTWRGYQVFSRKWKWNLHPEQCFRFWIGLIQNSLKRVASINNLFTFGC